MSANVPADYGDYIAEIAREIWKKEALSVTNDPELIRTYGERLSESIKKGYGKDYVDFDFDTPDYNKLHSLEKNAWQFSSAKSYTQLRQMSDALRKPDGTLRSFEEFRIQTAIITGQQLRHLKTEYNTALSGAQMASKWVNIQANKKHFPFLQFIAVEDEHTSALCNSLNEVIRLVDDPFWQQYYPPNHYNCRSTVRQLEEGPETETDKIIYPEKIPDIFKVNLGERGLAFPKDHAYFEGLPEEERMRGNRELSKYYYRMAERKLAHTSIEVGDHTILFNKRGLKDALNLPMYPEEMMMKKNAMIQNIDMVLKDAKYLGYNDYKAQGVVKYSHVFETKIGNKKVYLIIREMNSGEKYFYSVTDKPNVKIGLKTK